VAWVLASIAFMGGEARAGILQITISEGATSYVILDEGPLDTLLAPPPDNVNKIQAVAAALLFPDYKVIGLSASTNNPGDSTGANLTLGGHVQRLTSGAAPALIVSVTDTDYTAAPGGHLQSSASNTFTAAPTGDTRTFVSYFNPSNTAYATDVPQGPQVPLSFTSSGMALNSHGASAATVGVPSTSLYGLTSVSTITLSAAGADLVFGGSTQITAIPEPASMVLLALGVPLVVFTLGRKRRV
jgi:hypothetical protein